MLRCFEFHEVAHAQLDTHSVVTVSRKVRGATSFAHEEATFRRPHEHHRDSDDRTFKESARPPAIMMKEKTLERQLAKVNELEQDIDQLRQDKLEMGKEQLEQLRKLRDLLERLPQRVSKLGESRVESGVESERGERLEAAKKAKESLVEEIDSGIEDLKAAEVERHLAAWKAIKQKIQTFEHEFNHLLINRLSRAPRAGTAPMLVEAPNAEPAWLTLSWTNPAVKKAQNDLREIATREAAENDLGGKPPTSLYSEDVFLQQLQHEAHRRATAAAFLSCRPLVAGA